MNQNLHKIKNLQNPQSMSVSLYQLLIPCSINAKTFGNAFSD